MEAGRSRPRRTLPLLLALALVTGVSELAGGVPAALAAGRPVAADPPGDLRRAEAAVGRANHILEGSTARARAAVLRLEAVTAALPGARARVAETRGQVAAALAVANTARRVADRAQTAVDAAAERYRASAARVEKARQRVARFVTATYKGGSLVTLNSLLDARTVHDLTQRSGYAERVVSVQRRAVDDLLAARRAAKQDELDAERARRIRDKALGSAEAALTKAQVARQGAESAAAALAELAVERRRALASARRERAASLARLRRARIEAARVEADLRAWQARQSPAMKGPVLRPGTALLMPVRGHKSSDFGMRFDPVFHVHQLHAGIDFAAPGGQPIAAVAAGRVIRAGYNGGYGNFTCLAHGRYLGKMLSTCYAHQSAITVSVGQWVWSGQTIGRVGTTGASTGNHLHFEVRVDGRPVQPLSWLPSCLC